MTIQEWRDLIDYITTLVPEWVDADIWISDAAILAVKRDFAAAAEMRQQAQELGWAQ